MLSQGWTDTMDAAVKDPHASDYDATLQLEITDYDRRFVATPGYRSPQLRLLKAWLLVESGGPAAPQWTRRVAQIGNPGDAAYGVLRRGGEHAPLVVSQDLARQLLSKPIDDPVLNVRAGLAFIMMRAMEAQLQSVVDAADPAMHQHKVVRGDSLSRIAGTERSTVVDIRGSNPGLAPGLKPGQPVNFHHAAMKNVITGWQAIDEAFLARAYNGGGDSAYADKLRYVLKAMK